MKIFDATTVIAFLSDMEYPEGITALSKYHEIIIPDGVAGEVKKSPGKEMLQDLVGRKVIKIVKVDPLKVERILNEHPQLHKGECEAISFMETYSRGRENCIVSDDLQARKIFPMFNFKWTENLLDIMRETGIIDDETHASKSNMLRNSAFFSRDRR